MTLLTVSDFCILVLSLLTNFKRRKLAFRAWIPFDYSSVSAYLLTFVYQCLFAIICTFGCVASDTLYSGLLIHINCQFEILEHRLRNIESNENYSVNLCVRHHNHIYKWVSQYERISQLIFIPVDSTVRVYQLADSAKWWTKNSGRSCSFNFARACRWSASISIE